MPQLTNIPVVGLDFDSIKNSLKTYLRSQSQFEDYDFEGSSLNILLDVLAYNTHYNSIYLNMIGNEMFLESAQTRGSVIAQAKALGYVPQSARAATAVLDLSFIRNSDSPSTLIPKYTPFTFTQNTTSYTFLVSEDTTIDTSTNTAQVTVKEGTFFDQTFIFDDTNEDQKFIIPESNVDTTTIRVTVKDSVSSTNTTTYTLVEDFSSLTSTSTVYFLAETSDGKFEIYFGDDVIGKKPTNGNAVVVEYVVTSGKDANGAGSKETTSTGSLFTIATTISGYSSISASVNEAAASGADKQSINQIRKLAPLFHESQNRAVTIRDYEAIIQANYSSAEDVFVYGGEDAEPVQYGRVYISLKPSSGTTITNRVRNELLNILASKNMTTIVPEIVDPELLYLNITSTVKYDPRLTTKSSGTILSEVTNTITDFGDNTLEKFNRNFRFSKFSTLIDNTDSSISNNITDVSIYSRLIPTLGSVVSYEIAFGNQLHHPADGYSEPVITSDGFTYYDAISGENVTAYLEDDGSGSLRLYKVVSGTKTTFLTGIGTVNYVTGLVNINSFKPLAILSGNDYIRINAHLDDEDVSSGANRILIIDASDVSVNVISEINDSNTQIAGY